MKSKVTGWNPTVDYEYKARSKKSKKNGKNYYKKFRVVIEDEYGDSHTGSFKMYSSGVFKIRYGRTQRFIHKRYLKYKKSWESGEQWINYFYTIIIKCPSIRRWGFFRRKKIDEPIDD